ncbi:MAG: hypothetical protein R3B91_06420 [Planctomycetaceae bacterium]
MSIPVRKLAISASSAQITGTTTSYQKDVMVEVLDENDCIVNRENVDVS